MPGFTQQRDESEDDDEIRDECPPVTELYFVPEDKASIDAMFHTMASCQALHPDPQDESSPDGKRAQKEALYDLKLEGLEHTH